MKFAYLMILILLIIFLIFLKFNKKRSLKGKVQDSLVDALTFNMGLAFVLYSLLGKVLSIPYFSVVEESLLVVGIFIAGIILMALASDKYYKPKNLYKKIKERIKNGST